MVGEVDSLTAQGGQPTDSTVQEVTFFSFCLRIFHLVNFFFLFRLTFDRLDEIKLISVTLCDTRLNVMR